MKINPNYALTLYNRGIAYYDKHEYERAVADINQAIKINPNFARAFYDRGIAYYDKRDYDRTIYEYDQMAKAVPNYAVTVSGRGGYENRREPDRMIQEASPTIRNPSYAFAPTPAPSDE